MSSPATKARDAHAQDDDLDDIFNYDVSLDNAFRDLDQPQPNDQRSVPGTNSNTAALGIDEEVTIAKTKQKVAKLDQERLLSAAGIPKLRKISKERLKFKGKGHEFSDVVRLLNTYQLWLDDLYPRAKFTDGLAIIEKLGHTKRMQIMRKEWINEGKPKPTIEEEIEIPAQDELFESVDGVSREVEIEGTGEQAEEVPTPEITPSSSRQINIPEEDELDALLAEEEISGGDAKDSLSGSGTMTERPKLQEDHEDDFADEMEVMQGLDDW